MQAEEQLLTLNDTWRRTTEIHLFQGVTELYEEFTRTTEDKRKKRIDKGTQKAEV